MRMREKDANKEKKKEPVHFLLPRIQLCLPILSRTKPSQSNRPLKEFAWKVKKWSHLPEA